MHANPVDRAATAAELQAGAPLITAQWAATNTGGDWLLAEPGADVTNPALDVLAILGVSIWIVALLVLLVGDVSRAAHHLHPHAHGRDRHPRRASRRRAARR